ncbi:hypothetical protein [Streptomyces sp. NBC_00470]|uniref:hypothetical protein n=1 Tax=Streptomyces sp. NBC_00470 TaxID=2975753 RepID=UPI0030DE4117
MPTSTIKSARLDWRLHLERDIRQWWHGHVGDSHMATIVVHAAEPTQAYWDVYIGREEDYPSGNATSLEMAQRAVQGALTKALNRLAR